MSDGRSRPGSWLDGVAMDRIVADRVMRTFEERGKIQLCNLWYEGIVIFSIDWNPSPHATSDQIFVPSWRCAGAV